MKRAAVAALLLLSGALAVAAWWFGWRSPDHTEHVVVRGDTLSKLAIRYGVTVEDLRSWNGIEGDLIEVDQVLRIYVEPPEAAPEPVATAPSGRQRTRRSSSPAAPTGHGLAMPRPEPCLGLDTAIGEQGMVASAGLDRAQVKAALDPILPHALSCEPDEGVSSLRMTFEILVGCDGVVDRVEVSDGDLASQAYLDCVSEVLRHADFPAHDLPDGMQFSYPVTASW